ncbi:MAG TPA: hypothetical protein VF272_03920 [Candidatus Saccharimonadia bacterium]
MHYLAILGRQPEFGLVELESLLGSDSVHPFGKSTAIIDRELDLNRLGGTQKLGRILYRGPTRDLNEAPISLDELPIREGKTSFGLSYYGASITQRYVMAAGLTLKKRLRSKGSMRFVAPQTGTHLTAAQVKFNGLTRGGFELIVATRKNEMIIARTEQIQDIDWYAVRDYQRPTRSASVGMLPPKLAQILVNTTSAPLVYDPFTGTGVILQEALLLNRAARGSDLSEAMVTAAKENLTWLNGQRPDLPTWSIELVDARQLRLPDEPLAIVSEGYLGPNMGKRPTLAEVNRLRRELGDLYAESLTNWAKQLPSGAEVSITAPMWLTAKGWHKLDIIDRLSDLGYNLESFRHVDSRSLDYHRPNQIVGRQLLILRKQ